MRKDEFGNPCPETLGEYYDLVKAIEMPGGKASKFLEDKIKNSPNGREEKVIAPDSQMRAFLMPMIGESAEQS